MRPPGHLPPRRLQGSRPRGRFGEGSRQDLGGTELGLEEAGAQMPVGSSGRLAVGVGAGAVLELRIKPET